jgi:hypothetical protein
MAINPGYMGVVEVAGQQLKVNDCSIVAKQDVQIPDLVMGHYDHIVGAAGKIDVSGSCSGPATENFGTGLWAYAYNRDECGLLQTTSANIYYYCNGTTRTFNNLLINSMKISCAAGEIGQFSFDVMGAQAPVDGAFTPGTATEEKLLTWDQFNVTGNFPGGTDGIASFEVNIANGCTPVYSLNQADYYPKQIVSGIRTITGSISVYNANLAGGWDNYAAFDVPATGNITFDLGSVSIALAKVAFHRPTPALGVGPIITTIPFTCIGILPATFS